MTLRERLEELVERVSREAVYDTWNGYRRGTGIRWPDYYLSKYAPTLDAICAEYEKKEADNAE